MSSALQLPSATCRQSTTHRILLLLMKNSWKEVEPCWHYPRRFDVQPLYGNIIYIRSHKKDVFNSEDYFYKRVLCFKKCPPMYFWNTVSVIIKVHNSFPVMFTTAWIPIVSLTVFLALFIFFNSFTYNKLHVFIVCSLVCFCLCM